MTEPDPVLTPEQKLRRLVEQGAPMQYPEILAVCDEAAALREQLREETESRYSFQQQLIKAWAEIRRLRGAIGAVDLEYVVAVLNEDSDREKEIWDGRRDERWREPLRIAVAAEALAEIAKEGDKENPRR